MKNKRKKMLQRMVTILLSLVLIAMQLLPGNILRATDDSIINNGLKLSDFQVLINNKAIDSVDEVRNGDNVNITFDFEIDNSSKSSKDYCIDLNVIGMDIPDQPENQFYSTALGKYCGVYKIDNNMLYITLSDDVFNNENVIKGGGTLDGVVDINQSNVDSDNNTTLQIGNKKITIKVSPEPTDNASDCYVNKSADSNAVYDATNDVMVQTFRVRIESKNGTRGGGISDIVLTDIYGSKLSAPTNIKIVQNSWDTTNPGEYQTTYASIEELNTALTTLDKDEAITFTYDVTVSADILNSATVVDGAYSNIIEVAYKNDFGEADKAVSSAVTPRYTRPWVNKTGSYNENGTITWTITVNAGDLTTLDGLDVTVVDTLGEGLSYNNLTGTVNFDFNNFTKSGSSYTYTYVTKVDNNIVSSPYEKSLSNSVDVNIEGYGTCNKSTNVTKPAPSLLSKEYIADSFDKNNKSLSWLITYNVPESGISSLKIQDKSEGLNWYSDAGTHTVSLKEIYVNDVKVIENGAIVNTTILKEGTLEYYNSSYWKVEFNPAYLATMSGNNIVMKCSTIITDNNESKATYYNSAVAEYDGTTISKEARVTNPSNEIDIITKSASKIDGTTANWKIETNVSSLNKFETGKILSYKDSLPSGMELVPGSVKMELMTRDTWNYWDSIDI
ncbi:MAG: hypothetical protein IJB96_03920, partial [Lachnospira sp.]|nr:hypothetical protein [Lachnospira sp.]